MTAKCTRPGCGKSFDPADQNSGDCLFHTGGPVFHEGAKSWSCCRDEAGHRPVVSFDEFLRIPGCTSGSHSLDESNALPSIAPSPNAQPPAAPSASSSVNGSLATSFGATSITPPPAGTLPPPPPPAALDRKKTSPAPKLEEQDDEESEVLSGTKCKRLACRSEWEGVAGQKRGRGTEEECTYHPGTPVFHEGSKGYSCCKKRVLDFDDFLKLEGCKKGRHLFVGAKNTNGEDAAEEEEELVQCRMDHYQTPSQVIVSVFGKSADKSKSTVTFESQSLSCLRLSFHILYLMGLPYVQMTVSLALPGNKRFHRVFSLYGPIDPSTSSHRLIAPKCEITLAKADARSWPALTADDAVGAGHTTFGVGGRTGTVGGKVAVYDEGNKR